MVTERFSQYQNGFRQVHFHRWRKISESFVGRRVLVATSLIII